MRRFAFIVAILGIFVLILLIWMIPAREISDLGDLEGLEDNQRVILSGIVENERNYYENLIFEINNVKVICGKCENLQDKYVEVEGILDSYGDNLKVDVLRISIFG